MVAKIIKRNETVKHSRNYFLTFCIFLKMTCGAAYKRRRFTHSFILAHKYFLRKSIIVSFYAYKNMVI